MRREMGRRRKLEAPKGPDGLPLTPGIPTAPLGQSIIAGTRGSGWMAPRIITAQDVLEATPESKNRGDQYLALQSREVIASALTALDIPLLDRAKLALSTIQALESKDRIIVWDTRDKVQAFDATRLMWLEGEILKFKGVATSGSGIKALASLASAVVAEIGPASPRES